jgi:Na+/H+ antiporter NhaC
MSHGIEAAPGALRCAALAFVLLLALGPQPALAQPLTFDDTTSLTASDTLPLGSPTDALLESSDAAAIEAAQEAHEERAELGVPSLVLGGVPFLVELPERVPGVGLRIEADGIDPVEVLPGAENRIALPSSSSGAVRLVDAGGAGLAEATTRSIPAWLSILPPVVAIALALVFKRVLPALFVGIWFGAWTARGLEWGWFLGLLDTFQVYILEALADTGHASIILFSLMIGGMVGIISKSGGMQGVVNSILGWASTPRKGQLATGGLGLAVFFDDYANTLVVGNTMRAVTDRLSVSREKLAYIVDSTAAPVACLAFVTTWIGYEVGLINDAVEKIGGLEMSGYSIFLASLPYSFYPLLAIFLVFAVANSRRDFGPMYDAELRARTTGKVIGDDAKLDEEAAESKETQPKPGAPQRAANAIVPVATLVIGVLVGLYVTGRAEVGEEANLRDVIGAADSYKALLWASLLGMLVAAGMSLAQRILTLDEVVESWYAGLKSMLFAMIILVLAWALSSITEVLHTADFLMEALGSWLPAGLVPVVVFILAAATAFATGSSWGTMGILLPLVVPLAWGILAAEGHADEGHYYVLYSTVACVLGGAVWGDHCSPISDTTILSSMASGCDHIAHVRTQLPYALTAGGVAIFVGIIPTGFGFPWWASLVIGLLVISFGLRTFGRRVSDEVATVSA